MADTRIWTVSEALNWTREYLATKGDTNPRLSAEWLLSYATGLSRIELYAYFDRPLTEDERNQLRPAVARRAQGEPLQYVAGEMAFRHIVVKVRPGVLIPRPETETLVDLVLSALADAPVHPRVLDLCTGSGCIAASIAHECETSTVVATDVSDVACEVALENIERLGLSDRVLVVEGDLYGALDATGDDSFFDLIVSNPPYIPSAAVDVLEHEVIGHEPRLALDGGTDGLDVFRRILLGAKDHLRIGGALMLELDERNATQAAEIAVECNQYQSVVVVPDLLGRSRFLTCLGLKS